MVSIIIWYYRWFTPTCTISHYSYLWLKLGNILIHDPAEDMSHWWGSITFSHISCVDGYNYASIWWGLLSLIHHDAAVNTIMYQTGGDGSLNIYLLLNIQGVSFNSLQHYNREWIIYYGNRMCQHDFMLHDYSMCSMPLHCETSTRYQIFRCQSSYCLICPTFMIKS